MSPRDLWRLTREALAMHALRTRLSILAVAIGVGSVVLLVSLGEAARGYVTAQFAGLGSNLLIVMPGKVETTGGPPMVHGRTRELTLEDARSLLRLPRVVKLAPISAGTLNLEARGRLRSAVVIGSTSAFLKVRKLDLLAGSNLPQIDDDRTAQVCLLGARLRRELFGADNPLGEVVRLGEYRFRVIGLVGQKGQSLGIDIDDMVVVPVANVMQMIDRRGLFRILLQVRNFEEIDQAKRDVRAALIERHRGEEDFTIITQQAVMSGLGQILTMLTLALAAIASISLAVAGILIMNVTLISVVERTAEIGLIKAIGASNGQVLLIFLAEATAMALLGAAVGVAGGAGLAQLIGLWVPALPMRTPLWAVEAAVATALVVGLAFGALPALKAARLPPVDALRARV